MELVSMEETELIEHVKLAFDPKGILGRGNMFDEAYL